MNQNDFRTIAFGGLCQACNLTKQIANTGDMDQAQFETALSSILMTEPDQPGDVFGDPANVKDGLKEMINQLGPSRNKDAHIARYLLGLIALERRLAKKPNVLGQLGERIEQAKRQAEHFSLTHENVIANLASIYTDLISPLGAKIQVVGKPDIIQQTQQQNRIRAVLLSGLRAAVLWRQLGGSRRQIFFQRGKMTAGAEHLIQHL